MIPVIRILISILSTDIWLYLKAAFTSNILLLVLEINSFFSGFPPDQAIYFHEFLCDIFRTRYNTRGLLALILSLDTPCTTEALTLPHTTVILSGYSDVITGVYISYDLAHGMKNSKHMVFSMASHFLLIEWPEIVAEELLKFLF